MDAIFACPADKRRRQHELGNCALMVLAHKKLGLHHQDEGPFLWRLTLGNSTRRWPRSQLLLFLLGFLLHAVPPGNYLPDLSWARCISSAITSVSKMHCSRYCGHYTPVSRKIIGACGEPIRGAHDLSFLTTVS